MKALNPLSAGLCAGFLLSSLGAQAVARIPSPLPVQADVKPTPTPDPVKGFPVAGQVYAADDAPRARKQVPGSTRELLAAAVPADRFAEVLYDTPGDGNLWAMGATYKASFGADGCTYIPFFGVHAPRNYPVHFRLEGVRVGGQPVPFAAVATPRRNGNRIVLDRGTVREVYDLTPRAVEQTFVVDADLPGDVTVDLRVDSELRDDPATEGLQFGNAFGHVGYGTAFLVAGGTKTEITSTLADGILSLHVPAAERVGAQVVIDPVITTSTTQSVSIRPFEMPDLAFDATTRRYLVVWEVPYSASDIDLWSEQWNDDGSPVVGSLTVVDGTTAHWSNPRVANLNAYNAFLVVAEHYVAANPEGQRYTIRGRTMNAQTRAMSAQTILSGNEPGDKRQPDVGGDPVSATPAYWLLVYTRIYSATDTDILARRIQGDGTPSGSTIAIENSSATLFDSPQVSQANGDLTDISKQRWLVVYSLRFSPTDRDIYAAGLGWDGTLTHASRAVQASSVDDASPQVSAPAKAEPGATRYAVHWTRKTAQGDRWYATALDTSLITHVAPTHLNPVLGVGAVGFPRIESDGCRFACAFTLGTPAYAATLAIVGNAFVVQEARQQIGLSNDPYDLALTACAATGGSDLRYGIAWRDALPDPDIIGMAIYHGYANGGAQWRSIGCGGLGIQGSSSALIGHTSTLWLSGVGQDLAGMVIGVPAPALEVCPGTGCRLGIQLGGPMVNLPNALTLQLSIPCDPQLVGITFTVQGYAVGSGSCLGLLRLGNAVDMTVQ